MHIHQNPKMMEAYWPEVVRYYTTIVDKYPGLIYSDKSHFNLWLVEKLAETFPDSKFVGIIRSPYATVASMKLHQHSVTEDFFRGEQVPHSLVERGAKRYIRAWRRLVELEERDDYYLLNYEALVRNTEEELEYLAEFLGVGPFPPVASNVASLTKWKKVLTQWERDKIDEVISGTISS